MSAETTRIITCQECQFWTRTKSNGRTSVVSGICETYYVADNGKVDVIRSTISFRPCIAKDDKGNHLCEAKDSIENPF